MASSKFYLVENARARSYYHRYLVSGILGLVNLDGAPASTNDLSSMASLLQRRGPDRTALWSDGPAGLGHTLLATTPELTFERQPFAHQASGCVITADVRLDNREELLATLQLSDRAAAIGDAELIVEAYLAWGEGCAARLLGDFAFAVWDPKRRALFCARDQFGLRPLYYHHTPGRFFVFASEPRALLVLAQVPYQVNEGRVADYLVPALEWIDDTSTFFDQVFRLPPAHAVTVTAGRMTSRRYWTLEPGPELRLSSNEAYAEALFDVLTVAVRSRLRAAGPVGSMLSGGLDSGSVVAIASRLLSAELRPPLQTFSGVGPDPNTCIETRTIHTTLTMPGLEPHLVDYAALDSLMPELEELGRDLDEPFDFPMVILRAMYLTAQRRGMHVVLDGSGGDLVLNEGTHVIRLFRQGQWVQAFREAYRRDQFFGESRPITAPLRSARAALTPDAIRRLRRRVAAVRRTATAVRDSIMSPAFAERISLVDRMGRLDQTYGVAWKADPHLEHAGSIHPHGTPGRERYNRVASAVGVEPRQPFMDRRVVAFCVTLPGRQRLDGGWPKVVLRRAMAGRLPDAVRWRRGKQHLGWTFVTAVARVRAARMQAELNGICEVLRPFVDRPAVEEAWQGHLRGDRDCTGRVYSAFNLASWLKGASRRPVA